MTDETVNISELSDAEIQRYEEGTEAEQQMFRTADATAVYDMLRAVYAEAEGRFDLDAKLGRQKVFLSKLFRPCVICLSTDTRRTVDIKDFIESHRQSLKHDAEKAIAYPATAGWTWDSETRAISESLSANNRSVSILMIEVMRTLRSELQQLCDRDDDLQHYIRTITDAEITEAVAYFQMHDHAYFMSCYPQKSIEVEAEEAEESQEIFLVYQRRLLEADIRAYPAAVARWGHRLKAGEADIEARIRDCGPDLMSRWKNTLLALDAAEDEAGEEVKKDGSNET